MQLDKELEEASDLSWHSAYYSVYYSACNSASESASYSACDSAYLSELTDKQKLDIIREVLDETR